MGVISGCGFLGWHGCSSAPQHNTLCCYVYLQLSHLYPQHVIAGPHDPNHSTSCLSGQRIWVNTAWDTRDDSPRTKYRSHVVWEREPAVSSDWGRDTPEIAVGGARVCWLHIVQSLPCQVPSLALRLTSVYHPEEMASVSAVVQPLKYPKTPHLPFSPG